MKPLITTALLATLAAGLCSQNRTHYWVDPANGADTNAGSQASPFKTLTKALATKKIDTVVHLKPGTYGPATNQDFWDATAKKGKKISLRTYKNFKICGENRATCIVDFNGNTGVWYGYLDIGGGCEDIEICNLTFKNLGTAPWGNSPININGDAKRVNIHSNLFVDCNSTFIAWGGLDCAFHDNVIDSTKAKTGVAIRVRTHYWNTTNRDRAYIYNNLILNHGHGISYDGKTTSKQWIVNNIVLDSTLGFPGGAPHANAHIENNCAFGNTTNFANTTPSKTNLQVDPQLVDKAKKDFHLKSTSPCIEAGFAGMLMHELNDWYGGARGYDWNNDMRGQLDIGPHEMTNVSLTLVKDFAQGKTPEFSFQSNTPLIPLGFFAIGLGKSGSKNFPVYHVEPFGTFGLDPALILYQLLVALPTPKTGWKPVPVPIPTNSALNGMEVYIQGFGYQSVSGGASFKPTGRLDLSL